MLSFSPMKLSENTDIPEGKGKASIDLKDMTIDQLYSLFENDNIHFRWNRYTILTTLLDKLEENRLSEQVERVKKEILILSLRLIANSSERFDSMAKGTSEEGPWEYPDLNNDFTDAHLTYYSERVKKTSNPFLLSRYSDFLWINQKEVDYATMAIASYITSADIYLENGWDHELADALSRALSISCQINDLEKIEEAVQNIITTIEKLIRIGRPRYIIELVQCLSNHSDSTFEFVNVPNLISLLEKAITHFSENVQDSYNIQRGFLDQLCKISSIIDASEEREKYHIRIAENFEEEARWKRDNYPNGHAVAASILEDAMRTYMDIGTCGDKVEELNKKIQADNDASLADMPIIEHSFRIPGTMFRVQEELYSDKSLFDVLRMIAFDPLIIPRYEMVEKSIIKEQESMLLQHLFPITLVKGGLVVERISEEEKIAFLTTQRYVYIYQTVTHAYVDRLFEILEKNNPDYFEAIKCFLHLSNFFTIDRLELIKAGITRLENDDFIGAIHILTPQIEGLIRDFLIKHNILQFKYIHGKGGMQMPVMGSMLEYLATIQGVDTDLIRLIDMFLINRWGDNLRNELAHGLLGRHRFTEFHARLILLIIIRLSIYRLKEIESDEE